ncbi:MAG: hypothetical protein E6K69_02675 [Nitrospirae bacterium]|nr:MAG: hypothetical protein E6K69_02675 [Nitrospirota bacterium]
MQDGPPHARAGRNPGSGILVFNTSLQVLHRNPEAVELSRRIQQAETGTGSGDVLPRVITDLCHKIRRDLQIRIDAGNWGQFQVRRLIGAPQELVVLNGIGLPDRGGWQRSRILIMMKEVGTVG